MDGSNTRRHWTERCEEDSGQAAQPLSPQFPRPRCLWRGCDTSSMGRVTGRGLRAALLMGVLLTVLSCGNEHAGGQEGSPSSVPGRGIWAELPADVRIGDADPLVPGPSLPDGVVLTMAELPERDTRPQGTPALREPNADAVRRSHSRRPSKRSGGACGADLRDRLDRGPCGFR